MDDVADGEFTGRAYLSSDGLKLYARDYGRTVKDLLPVICLPGLTRNSRDFHELAIALSQDAEAPRRVITLDYRGRGLSEWDENKANYNLGIEAGDVLTACSTFGIERAIFIGTSRGGLILHLIAEMKPALIAALVLNDIGPAIEAKGLMRIRDYLNAGRTPNDWDDAIAILKDNHGTHFTNLEEGDWQTMAQAIYREVNAKPVADFDPAIATQLMSVDFTKPLPDLWGNFEKTSATPLLLIRGENSELLSKETTQEMRRRHQRARVFTATGQGHAPLLHPEDVLNVVKAFVAEQS
jgi:pimeloyl-ACP methyl ester carboxylesterase